MPVLIPVSVPYPFSRDDFGRHARAGADRQFPVFQLNQSLDAAVDDQILIARNLALDVQARTEPGRSARRCVRRIC
jgi:hypothetical protein